MPDLSREDPLGRFSGCAGHYARHRPAWPDEAVMHVIDRAALGPGSLLVDVGSGTGLSSRLFASRGLPVIGIEPNDDMRARAEAEPGLAPFPPPSCRAGRAEATGLPDGVADLVLAAQAFHWFDADRALAEFHRVLKPGGWVAVLQYERDGREPFTAAYGAALSAVPDAARIEASRRVAALAVARCPLLVDHERRLFAHAQELDRDGLKGRALSVSYLPRDEAALSAFTAELDALFDRFQQGGQVTMAYEVTLDMARRPVEDRGQKTEDREDRR